MAQDTNDKAVILLLRFAEPHIVTKTLELVYTDEGSRATAMGPEGSPMLLFAWQMQKKMLGTVLELLNRCEGERDLNALKEGLRAWVTRS